MDVSPERTAASGEPDLEPWVGRERTQTETISLKQARGLAATLDRDPGALLAGSPLPYGWHWIYFNAAGRRSDLAEDGHEKRGGFLPPVQLPRRMWAGGRIRFLAPLTIESAAAKTSTIASVVRKEGRSGSLVFVTVRHRISGRDGAPAVDEEQDLVYRGMPSASGLSRSDLAPVGRPDDVEWVEAFRADAVTLFRFSALTFNGHRIHYDHPYATSVEGYPGLVVHGPLIALLLLDAGTRWSGAGPSSFEYRAVGPLFCDESFELAGRRVTPVGESGSAERLELWASHPERGVAMKATLETSRP